MEENQEKTQERIQEGTSSLLDILPGEIILEICRRTNLYDIKSFQLSGPALYRIFKASKKACYRGMEVEQFSHWRWLLGDSRERNPAQIQNLKDAIAPTGLAFHSVDRWNGWWNIFALRRIEPELNRQKRCFEESGINMLTRTAICFFRFGLQRTLHGDSGNPGQVPDDVPWPDMRELTTEERIMFFKEQTTEIQFEICGVLETVVCNIAEDLDLLENGRLASFIKTNLMESPEKLSKVVKQRLGELMVGHVLNNIITSVSEATRFRSDLDAADIINRAVELEEMFEDHIKEEDKDLSNACTLVSDGVMLAKEIGFDINKVLVGRIVEESFD